MATSQAFSTTNQYIKYRIVVTEVSQDIATNRSVVNVKVQAWRTNQGYTTDGAGYCYTNTSGDHNYSNWSAGQKPITYNSYTTLFDQNITTEHESDGTKNLYVSAYIEHSRFSSNDQGFNVQLTRIPRQANLTGAPNFNDIDNPTINYSNPAGNIVSSLQACISLNNSTANIGYRDINKTGSSYTFNLTQAERNTLLAACPNSNTLTVYFIIKTVLAGVTYYSSAARTMTVKNANPTISGSSYYDTNAATIAITTNNQDIIQNNSTVQFKFSTLTALKYSALSNIKITINGVSVNSSLSGSTASNKTVNFGVVNSDKNEIAIVELTDSRGNKTQQNININMLAWKTPSGLPSLSRRSNFYDDTYIKVNAYYSSLNEHNTISIKYQYKETTASAWSAEATLQDGVTATITLDNTKAFNFRFIISDRIGSTTYNLTLPVGMPILMIDRLLRSIGINTLPTNSKVFDVGDTLIISNTARKKQKVKIATSALVTYIDIYSSLITASDKRLITLREYDNAGVAGGVIRLSNQNTTDIIDIDATNGKIKCVTLQQTSSRKVKENIKPLTSEEAIKVLLLEAVTFDFRDKVQGENKRGFIAEDVAEIIPELVAPETSESPAALDYIGIIPYLQKVLKDQADKIKELEDRISKLENGNA